MDPSFLEATMDVSTVIRSYDVVPPEWHSSDTYESIIFPEGYEKPSKDDFETKLREYRAAKPLRELRQERNRRLTSTDFLMTEDYPFPSPEIRQAWKTYRTALRNLPVTSPPTYDENGLLVVTWPTPPIWPANVV
jgi:hypothetical protein|tara:strand:- start:113 stop:517 length:405 start_codon:yes stop_codon:yes gene_type:complete